MKITDKLIILEDIKGLPEGLIENLFLIAKKININKIAIVGGIVRDLINMKINNYSSKQFRDLDIAIEGSASEYYLELIKTLGSQRVKLIRNSEAYKTVEITLDGIKVDIATTRIENYKLPAENPIVRATNLEKDLSRRDFNINSIAIELPQHKIIDLHDGIEGIKKKEFDFIHSKSVLEDPTRVIRAARYAARLNFKMSSNGVEQIKSTINAWPWEWQVGSPVDLVPSALGNRLRMEMELLLKNEPWEVALKYLQDWGGLSLFDKRIQENTEWFSRIKSAKELKVDPLIALLAIAENEENLASRFQLSSRQKKLLEESSKTRLFTKRLYESKEYLNWKPSEWTNKIEDLYFHPDAIAIEICLSNPLKKPLLMWFKHWRFIQSPITGMDLLEKGWKPGPSIGKELKRQRNKKLDQEKLY